MHHFEHKVEEHSDEDQPTEVYQNSYCRTVLTSSKYQKVRRTDSLLLKEYFYIKFVTQMNNAMQ